ncbi:MAG: transglycosylase domain-containing protein [Acidimicrobiia bacterium]|nr:transglycosylase domain-containing protein [Acidimicrobiia bacterium]
MRRLFYLVGLLFIAGIAGAGWVVSQVPLPPAEPLVQTSYVCAADVTEGCGPDNAIAQLSGTENRISVKLDDVPDVVIDAVLAQEDRNFFSHSGLDPVSIGRALWTDIRHQRLAQGGSTITQQYVKNVYLTDDRTLMRKVREAALAVKLERELGKEEILERYLNTIYFGRGAYGIEAASRAYFGRPASQIGISEAAFFAGLIRAPESAEPTRFPEEADRRRNNALVRMVADGHITQDQMDEANATPVADLVLPREVREGLGNVTGSEYGTEYFVDDVRQLLIEEFGAAAVYGGGLRVYTSLDLDVQRAAYESITSTLDPANPDEPAAALVSLDQDNNVIAMVGGTDFATSQVNLALGRSGGGSGRGPGSAYKPFALSRALMDDMSLRSSYDAPQVKVFPEANNGEDWKVTGGGSPTGEWSLLDAMRVSSNTVFAQLMLDLGPARVNDIAERSGVTADLPDVPSVVLGAGEVSVMDMASAYTTFRDHGEHGDPVIVLRVTDPEGRVLWEPDRRRERVMPGEIADMVTHSLEGVIGAGTGRRAAVPGQIVAGKTGTTTDNRDAWFVGYSCEISTAVWMGFPTADAEGNPRLMSNVRGIAVSGGTFPAEIWSAFMTRALEGREPCPFPDVEIEPAPTTTVELECPVDSTDTTDPGTPIELCPPITSDSSTTTSSTSTTAPDDEDPETFSPTTTTTAPPTTTTAPPPSTTTTVVPREDGE